MQTQQKTSFNWKLLILALSMAFVEIFPHLLEPNSSELALDRSHRGTHLPSNIGLPPECLDGTCKHSMWHG